MNEDDSCDCFLFKCILDAMLVASNIKCFYNFL